MRWRTAVPEARGLTRAAPFQGEPVPVTARFSDGAEAVSAADLLPEVRGLAVRFYLPERSGMDIVAQTVEHFPVARPEEFVALLRAAGSPARLPRAAEPPVRGLVGIPRFLATHPRATVRPARDPFPLTPPASFASVPCCAIHAYRWVSADGEAIHVRYTLRSRGRSRQLDPLRAPGDPVDGPSQDWLASRCRVEVGTLSLTGLDETRERDGDVLVFDPTSVCEGAELTDDPVLRLRSGAYRESVAGRTAGARP